MEFLRAGVGRVVAPVGVQRFVAHDEVPDKSRDNAREQQDQKAEGNLIQVDARRCRTEQKTPFVGWIASRACAWARTAQSLCFPTRCESKGTVVRMVRDDSPRQARAGHREGLFRQQFFQSGWELDGALLHGDSAAWAADVDGLSDSGDRSLAVFTLLQCLLQKLELHALRCFHYHMRVIRTAPQQVRCADYCDENGRRRDGRIGFVASEWTSHRVRGQTLIRTA